MQEKSELAQERALKRLVFEEEQRIAAEERAARQRAEAEQAAQLQEQRIAETEAAQILSSLRPVYARRNEAAQKLYAVIGEYYQACIEIDTGRKRANQAIWPHLQRLDAYLRSEVLERVQRNSGLQVNSEIPLPQNTEGDLTYTVCMGIFNGHIRPGEIFLPNLGRVPIMR